MEMIAHNIGGLNKNPDFILLTNVENKNRLVITNARMSAKTQPLLKMNPCEVGVWKIKNYDYGRK